MRFLDWIIEELEDIADFFYDAYQEVKDWWPPFDLLKYPLYGIYGRFHWLADEFGDFNEWVDDIAYKITRFFSELDLEEWFTDWKGKILDAWYWFIGRWAWFQQEVADWWSTIWPYVEGYIDTITEGFDSLGAAWDNFWTVTFPEWISSFDSLKAEWDNFWTVTWPNLLTFDWLDEWWQDRLLGINELISSWFVDATPFWDGWQDVKDNVINFFTDPLGWLEEKFTDWFLGTEE